MSQQITNFSDEFAAILNIYLDSKLKQFSLQNCPFLNR